MYSFEAFSVDVIKDRSFEQIKLVEAKQLSQPNDIVPQAGNADWIVVILVPLSFTIVCATIGSIVVACCKVTRVRSNKVDIITHYEQLPCTKCRFFNNNHYLKCAVHPASVLTKEALDCSDYCC